MTALTDHFDRTYEKNGFTYVSWSQVADRLDEASSGWTFNVVNVIGDDCVLGRLTLGDGRWFENVGYAENAEQEWKKEPLKDAVSDAFKRCAALAGVARYLYDKDAPHTTSGTQRVAPVRPAAPASPPRSVVPLPPAGEAPEEPEYLAEIIGAPHRATVTRVADEVASQDGFCPDHGLAWVLRPGGVSKTTGKPYDAFWSCPSDERPFCKKKPSARWSALQEMAS